MRKQNESSPRRRTRPPYSPEKAEAVFWSRGKRNRSGCLIWTGGRRTYRQGNYEQSYPIALVNGVYMHGQRAAMQYHLKRPLRWEKDGIREAVLRCPKSDMCIEPKHLTLIEEE